MSRIRLKRVYGPPSPDDGLRILVDRLWPRGLTKDAARIDLWLKDIAPSAALRQWFGHDPARWPEFRKRYRAELAANPEATASLRGAMKSEKQVTLLFGAKDEERNNAVVLREALERG
ncbi:MAG: DUF488 domain-containing protein [Steroidobacteraceae bacterium]